MGRRVLIVAYAFPPSNSVAVHRVLRLSKWLPKYGWEPTILTVKTTRAHPYFYNQESSILDALVPDVLDVHRSTSFEWPKNRFIGKIQAAIMGMLAIPDLYITWVPGAVSMGKKLIAEKGIDVVVTTLGPHSTALIGYFLAKRTSVKWVMDYRDPWCSNPFKSLGGLRYSLEKRLEDVMVANSDFNVTTSSLITALYRDSYPALSDQFATITNCYDPELQFVSAGARHASQPADKFRIVHAGSFYPKRNPTSFLEGLAALLRAQPELQKKIEVIFVGEVVDKYKDEISKLLGDFSIEITLTGTVSYDTSMQYMCNSELLLAINGIEDRDNIFIPGKLFDYIAANRPVLLLGHRGAASDIVEQGNLGAVCGHNDIEAISQGILRFYRRWEQSLPFDPNSQNLEKFYAPNVAEKLAQILDSVADSGPSRDRTGIR